MRDWTSTPHPIRSLLAAVALLGLLQALPHDWHLLLRYERAAVLDGQLWRVFTGHLIHLGWTHWALNMAALGACLLLADRPPSPGQLARQVLLLSLGISLLFALLQHRLAHYVGLSGVLYGLFLLQLWPGARRLDPLSIAALCTVGAWLGGQLVRGPDPREMALIGGNIIVQAHVFGLVCAAVMLVVTATPMARRPGSWRQLSR